MRLCVVIVLSSLLFGCAEKEEAPPAPPKSASARTEPTSESTAAPDQGVEPLPTAAASAAPTTGKAPPQPMGAVAIPNLKACVAGCVDNNKMKAEGPAKIEADCRKVCHDSCVAHCGGKASSHPVGFRKNCEKDCAGQLERLGSR